MDKAKLIPNGNSQAVRLPKKYRLNGDEVYIKKIGNCVLLLPKDNPWINMLESLNCFSPDFLTERDQPPIEDRQSI